jgi:hypothetical protein
VLTGPLDRLLARRGGSETLDPQVDAG